jgi:hypothetical protein
MICIHRTKIYSWKERKREKEKEEEREREKKRHEQHKISSIEHT